jgi:hypothetical protein
MNFKGTETFNMNFSHQMKLFDINIVCFSCLNDTFFSLSLEFDDISLFFLNLELKNNKNKFLYQDWIGKILRTEII